jgi:hypothetical protein
MKYRFAAVLMFGALACYARAQTPPADSGAAPQTTDSTDDGPSTEPAVDETEAPPAPVNGVVPTTQEYRATTRPYHRHYRRPILRSGAQAPFVTPTPQPGQMSHDFDVVLNRSIFIHGDERTTEGGGGFAPPIGSAAAPENSLVFNGVTQSDSAVAMVENTETHEILKLRVGDSISHGRVLAITLNNLDYQVGGRVTRVSFGETLSGGSPEGDNAIASPGAPGTTQPSNTSNSSVTRQLGESIEAYMRRRHAMGL